MEVWIEIEECQALNKEERVTSLVEVWIEIEVDEMGKLISQVTSLVEVWIEILPIQVIGTFPLHHFPCGSVD